MSFSETSMIELAPNPVFEQQLRDVNEALLISSVRLHEQVEKAEKAEAALNVKRVELADSRMLLETALSAGSIATVTWDIVNDIMIADQRMADVFGIDPAEDGKLPIADFISAIYPDDQLRVKEQIARTLETDEPYEIEYRIKADGRDIRWFYVRGKVERDAAGKPLRFAAALIDITERKETDESKCFLASIVESSRDSIITVDFDTTITSWNPAAESLYGYSAEEAIGKSMKMLLLPKNLAEIFGSIDKIRLGESVEMFETVRVDKEGQRLDLEVVMSPVKDSLNKVVGVSTIVRDITERLESEEALRFSEQRFSVAVDAMDSLVWTNNPRGEMEGEQPGWGKFTGQTFDQYQGFGWSKAVHPDDADKTIDAWNKAVSRNETFVFEHRLRRHDGEWRVCAVRAVPVMTADGEVKEWVGAHTDITDRKQTEEDLRRSREELESRVKERTAELEQANKKLKVENRRRLRVERDRVGILRRLTTAQEDERRRIGRDLHDQIGQQITAMRFKLQELQTSNDDSSINEKIGQAQDYAKQMDADVGFLAYELRPQGLDDLGLRASVRDFVQHWSRYHNIPAEFHGSKTERRQLASEINIHIYRIVQESLNNILKHAQAKGVVVILDFQVDNLILIIEDDGVGFDPIHNEKAATRSGGLGLVGMRERCLLVGGTMSIESAVNEGTVILCRIPIPAKKTGIVPEKGRV
ncbi:MAG: PAS domain S-box protein [Pyrinomonadaceae bacterium]